MKKVIVYFLEFLLPTDYNIPSKAWKIHFVSYNIICTNKKVNSMKNVLQMLSAYTLLEYTYCEERGRKEGEKSHEA